jgi:drug/metabolite transporter superfamily protein YnfA
MDDHKETAFEKAAGGDSGGTLLGEIWYLLRHNKKWWLVPILLILLVFGLFMILSGTAAAPFIYTLF